MTPDRERLRELAERATPGPWDGRKSGPDFWPNPWFDVFKEGDYEIGEEAIADGLRAADAVYIAAAHPQAVLALLDDLRDAEAERDRLRHQVRNALTRLDGHTCHAGHTDADHLRLYRQVVAEIESALAPDPPAGT